MFHRFNVCGFIFALGLFAAIPIFGAEVAITKDDLVLRADYDLADGSSESGDTVLIVHGTLAHNRMEIITQFTELMRENGFNTLAINLSYSISERPSAFYDCNLPHYHSHYNAAEEISAWVTWLEKKQVNRIIVAGHSRGGNQAGLYLQNPPPSVTHGILFAPATWDFENTRKNYGSDFDRNLEQAAEYIKQAKPNTMLQNIRFLYCDQASVSAASFSSYYADDPFKDTPQLLRNPERPFLVFAGGKDDVVDDLPQKMTDMQPSGTNNVKLIVIDEADHYFRDLNMDDAVDYIMDYLAL